MARKRQPASTIVVGGSQAMARLQEKARSLGYIADKGTEAGKGSLSAMLRAIILDELTIIPKETTAGLQRLAWTLGFYTTDSKPDVLALLRGEVDGIVTVVPGLVQAWVKFGENTGRGVSPTELSAIAQVERALPAMVAAMIDRALGAIIESPQPAPQPESEEAELTPARARERIAELSEGVE